MAWFVVVLLAATSTFEPGSARVDRAWPDAETCDMARRMIITRFHEGDGRLAAVCVETARD
jgi:hypothetical protein